MSTPTRLAIAAGLLAAAGLAALVVALLTSSGPAAGGNRSVNPPGFIDAYNSPAAAQHPDDPDSLVVAYRKDRPEFSAALQWSPDGGTTWRATALPLPEDRDRPFAPDIAFGPDGTLYVLYANLTGAGNTPETLWLARSDDAGRTLSDPVAVAGERSFQGRLAVAPDGTIHVTYLQATDVGVLALTGPATIVAVSSDDGGQTFSEPVQVSDPARELVGAATPVVDADGELAVLYQDHKDNVRDFGNLEGPPWEEPSALVVTRSSDGGATFDEGVVVDDGLVGWKRFLVFLPEFPSLAAGPDGTLYTAWADARHGAPDVFLSRSEDGGRTWTAPARVNDTPVDDGTSQYLPTVSAAPSGRVDVLYYDRSDDPEDVMTTAMLAWSTDRGETFDHLEVSDERFDSRIGSSAAPHLEPDFGTRLGLVSWEEGALAAWTDTRLGDEASGRQDVVVSRVALPQGGFLAWAVAGVLLAGAAALALAAFAGRRRRTDADGDDEQTSRSPGRGALSSRR